MVDAGDETRRPTIEEERARADRLRRLLEKESMRAVGESERDRAAASWWSSRSTRRSGKGGRLR